jgi:hypothetical protein
MMDLKRLTGLVCVLAVGAGAWATYAQTPPPGGTATSQPAGSGAQTGQPGDPAADTPPDQPARTPPGGGTPAPPTQEEVIEAFERDRPAGAPIPPVEAVGGPKSDETKVRKPRARYPDGYVLIDRPGRISREGQWWVFTFESDSPTFEEPPVRLLPNRMLEHAVYEVEGSPHAVFVISGEVTDYEGQNYLLLRKLLRRRVMDNLSR